MGRDRFRIDAADAAMLVVILIWAFGNVVAKASIAEIVPFGFIFARLLIVLPVVFLVAAMRGRLEVPCRRDWPMIVLAGLCGYGLYNVLYILGIERTSPFSVALLLSLGPVFTLLFASILRIERVTAEQWIGVAIAFVGVAIFLSDKLRGGVYHPFGDVLTIGAGAVFAIYSLASRPITRNYGAPTATAWAVLVGFLIITPITWRDARDQDWSAVGPIGWAGLFFAAYVSLLVGYNLWTWAIQRAGVGRTAPYLLVLPVLTGIMSAVLTGERFGPLKVLGAMLVLAGTAVVRLVAGRAARRKASQAEMRSAVESGTMPSEHAVGG